MANDLNLKARFCVVRWNSKVAQPLAAYWIILAVAADPNYTAARKRLMDSW